MLNILGKRYWFFALSLVIILSGILLLAVRGVPISIDFKGGTLLEVEFASGNLPDTTQVKAIYDKMDISDAQIQTTPDGIMILRSSAVTEDQRVAIVDELSALANEQVLVRKFDTVGPTISQKVTRNAALAVSLAALAVVVYITWAFRGVQHAFRFGLCAILAMLHDVLIVVSVMAIGGNYFGWQVDSLFLTALLTVIGFSVQDKIVVFDRIRENSNIYRKLPFETLANHSIIQTLQRSINTQLMTVEFMLLAMALFGGVTLREFSVILLVGLLSGTYSSIFIAAPTLVVWENQEWKTWFKKNRTSAA